jgi:hypothetical protein
MRRRPGRLGLALSFAGALTAPLGACRGGDRGEGGERGGPPSALAAGPGAGSTGTAAAAAAGAAADRAAEPEGPTGELVHALDRRSTQGFGRGDLAVGGGWIYWIERPRAAGPGKDVVRRKPAARPAAEPETVAGPGRITAIAADADRLYVAADSLASRLHAGGAPSPIASGAWLEIVPGDKHLLIRSRDQVALVAKAGGPVETVWEGKHGKLSVDADGDRFIAIPVSPWAQKTAARAITVYAPGARPAVLAELPEARGDLAVDGGWIYFGGQAGATGAPPPLWRIPRAGGAGAVPERVGDPAWGFGDFLVREGSLYGMIFTGAWRLQKLALTPGARPVVLESRVPAAIQALAADAAHVYYLTDFEVKRAPR